jgi:hypothetical protein
MPAGVWLITLLAGQGEESWMASLRDGGGLTPLGQVVASIWSGLAFESGDLALGDFAVVPDGIVALLYVPWVGGARAIGGMLDRFKQLVAYTARRAGFELESHSWQPVDGRLIEDPLELVTCRSEIKAGAVRR